MHSYTPPTIKFLVVNFKPAVGSGKPDDPGIDIYDGDDDLD